MKKKTLFIAALSLAITACNGSIDDRIDGVQNLVTFSGTIAGQNTTRVSDNAWEANDAIGISASSADGKTSAENVKYVTTDGSGTFTAAVADNVITFGSEQKADFAAYYPYSDDGGTLNVSTAANNQTADNQKNIDYLFATASAKIISPKVDFTFSHAMSRIVINIVAGTGVANLNDLTAIELGNIYLNGTFNTATGGTTPTGSPSALSLTPSVSSGATSHSESLILLPQEVTDSKLSLTLTYNSMQYAATLTINDAADGKLKAGYSLEYNVTLNKTSLTVSSGSINPWNSSSMTAEANEVIQGPFVSAENAELYALAFTDGTYLNIWDSENKKIDEEMWDEYTSNTQKTVCGIVYWLSTGSEDNVVTPLTDDKILEIDHSNCTHGYILALKDMVSGDIKWQDSEESVFETFQSKDGNSMNPDAGSYQSIVIGYDDTNQLQKALGYNNTKVLRAYNYDFADAEHKVLPIKYLDEFAAENDAPKGSSGWYLPSPKELVLMVLEDNSEIRFYDYGSKTTQFDNIQLILEALGENASEVGRLYWSSSESKYTEERDGEIVSNYYAWVVYFYSIYYGRVNDYSKDGSNYVRAVCAF
jgi:hypothetical protein